MRISTIVLVAGILWLVVIFVVGETSYVRAISGSMIWRLVAGMGGFLLTSLALILVLSGY